MFVEVIFQLVHHHAHDHLKHCALDDVHDNIEVAF